MKIKCGVKFYLEKRKDKETDKTITANVPILLLFTFDGKRLQYYSGYRIDGCDIKGCKHLKCKSKWDYSKQEVKRNNFNADGISSSDINDHLNDIRSKVTEIYKEFKALKMNPSSLQIKNELRKRLGEEKSPKKELTFFDLFDKFINEESKARTWTSSTIKKFKTNYNHLKEFQDEEKIKIEFEDIDEAFFGRYFTYQSETLGHRNTTIAKNLKIFKCFLNWATKRGYNKNLKFKDYTPKYKGSRENQKIIFLTWDELMYLNSYTLSKRYLEQVRDVFCFCCFTGLRYSDVFNLKRSCIKNDSIEITTIKTDDRLIIDLNKFSKAILDKYKDIPFKDDKCLPVISNQKMNVYLKELGEQVELNQPETVVFYKGAKREEKSYKKYQLLSTHAGRKTFISNALFFNIPAEVIMSWTGHKDHRVMESYYKIIATHKRREMDKFNEQQNDLKTNTAFISIVMPNYLI